MAFLADWFLWWPLRRLYLDGWWGGVVASEVCASITQVPAAWWERSEANAEACEALLDRKSRALGRAALVAAYLAIAMIAAVRLCCRWFYLPEAARWLCSRFHREAPLTSSEPRQSGER